MKKIVGILLCVLILMMVTSCVSEDAILYIDNQKSELITKKEELKLQNEELAKTNNELTLKIDDQKEINASSQKRIESYKEQIESNNKNVLFRDKDIGCNVDEFILNNNAYSILSDYGEFREVDDVENLDIVSANFSHNHNKQPIIVYELYEDDKTSSNIFMVITYRSDTRMITRLQIGCGNYEETEKTREELDKTLHAIVCIYMMSVGEPIIYSDKVDEMAKEFIKNKVWDDGNVTMTVLDFPKFGTIFIE